MHDVLVRFNFAQPFSFEWLGSVPLIGASVLLIPWTIAAILSLRGMRRRNEAIDPLTIIFWVGLPIVVGVLAPQKVPATGLPVFSYGFMLFVGFITATISAANRARLIGQDSQIVWDLGAWLLIPGIIGARSFYIIQYHERLFARCVTPLDYIKTAVNLPDGGLVFYGGIILGIGGYLTYCYLRRMNPMVLADVIAPSIFIGLGFGRIGCFMYGCCFGDSCDLPWAVSFPPDSVPFRALVDRGFMPATATGTFPLHPSQLYSSLNAFVLALLLAVYFRHRAWNGAVLAMAWIIYPITRYVLELLRGDELGQFNTTFTISQWVSFGMFASGIVFLIATSIMQPRLGRPGKPLDATAAS